ncbi:MAG: hypothetical protein HY695_38775 [Deltaproteobacteria bacterium]|nr:hypothetical protein [Deltaproteobacteria bacterium]
MKGISLLLSVLAIAGTVGWIAAPGQAQEGVLLKIRAGETNYCHMKFPAIREETLYSTRPVLKDAATSDVIDFYGPCDYDPRGKEEVHAQRLDEQRQLFRGGHSD